MGGRAAKQRPVIPEKVGKTMRKFLLLTTLALSLPFSGLAEQDSPAPTMPPSEVIFESSVGDVHFPHDRHLKLGCAQCHHQIKAGPLKTPHPGYMDSSWIQCETCHSEEATNGGAYYKCGKCHHDEPDNIADETLSSKVVTHKSCWKCHQSGTGPEASEGCGECHEKNQDQ
jgi:hypothetical protein